ncbi:uncharacterized, partial [Tachysurus ichikawai]
ETRRRGGARAEPERLQRRGSQITLIKSSLNIHNHPKRARLKQPETAHRISHVTQLGGTNTEPQ